MAAIEVSGLRKVFRNKTKEPGLRGSLQALLRPTYSEAAAVKGISFEVETAISWHSLDLTVPGKALPLRC